MAKLKGPLASLSAKGEFAGTVVFNEQNGIKYARYKGRIRSNSKLQALVRLDFKEASEEWRKMNELEKAVYNTRAEGKSYTGRNLFIKESLEGSK